MSEVTNTPAAPVVAAPVPTAAPASPASVQAPVAAPPPVATTPAAAESKDPSEVPAVGEPGWLKARIDQATESGEKKARKALKAERNAAKAAAQEAVQVKEQSTSELAAAKRFADSLLSEIPEGERNAISQAAGGSVSKTLEFLTTWRLAKGMTLTPVSPAVAPPAPVATAPVTPATEPAPPVAKPPLAAPAHTAPAGSAPAPAAPTGPEDYRGTYENLRVTNPYLAMQYLLNNQDKIVPDRLRPVDQQGRPTQR